MGSDGLCVDLFSTPREMMRLTARPPAATSISWYVSNTPNSLPAACAPTHAPRALPMPIIGNRRAPDFESFRSFASDQNNGSSGVGGQQFKVYQFGVDGIFKQSVFSLQSEYIGRWLDYEAGNTAAAGETSALYAHGFYVQGGVFLVPSLLELTGRVSAVWTDGGPQDGNAVEAGPGFNWFISRSHKVKLQVNLLYIDISADLPNPSENLDAATPSFSSSAANIERGEQGLMLLTQIQLEL